MRTPGCPEPGGVTFRELAAFLYSLEDLHVVAVDVMEVSPNLDPANITAAPDRAMRIRFIEFALQLNASNPGAVCERCGGCNIRICPSSRTS